MGKRRGGEGRGIGGEKAEKKMEEKKGEEVGKIFISLSQFIE